MIPQAPAGATERPPGPGIGFSLWRHYGWQTERVVGWYKECRRLGTRYEKLAVNYVAFWMVAIIEKVLNFGLSDSA